MSTGGEFSVGRGPGVDWVLPDPERLLSKRHFAVAYRGGSWQLADTSTNGTFLNREGDPIGAGDLRRLRDGDRVRVGAYEIEMRLVDDEIDASRSRCPTAARSPIRSRWTRSGRPSGSAIRSTSRTIRACGFPPARRNCRTISTLWRPSRTRRRSTAPRRRTTRR